MIKTLTLVLALTSCAASQRHILKTCPTLQASLFDFVATGVALAASTATYSSEQYGRTAVLVGIGGGIALSSNLSECRR